MVDGTVTFIGDDKIEHFNWNSGIIYNLFRPDLVRIEIEKRLLFVFRIKIAFSFEH